MHFVQHPSPSIDRMISFASLLRTSIYNSRTFLPYTMSSLSKLPYEILSQIYKDLGVDPGRNAVPPGIPVPKTAEQKAFNSAGGYLLYDTVNDINGPQQAVTISFPVTDLFVAIPDDTTTLLVPKSRADNSRSLEEVIIARREALHQLCTSARYTPGFRERLASLRYVAVTDDDTSGERTASHTPLHDPVSQVYLLDLDKTLAHQLEYHWISTNSCTVPDGVPAKLIIHSSSNNVPCFNPTEWPECNSSLCWEAFTSDDGSINTQGLQNFGRNIGRAGHYYTRNITISVSGEEQDRALMEATLSMAPDIHRRLSADGYVFSVLVGGKVAYEDGGLKTLD